MIVTTSESWLHFMFATRGTTWPRIWRRLLLNMTFAVVVTGAHEQYGLLAFQDVTPLPFTLIGFVLSIFLGFRINTAYERWWEGRKMWGQLVNTSRSMARQIMTLVGPSPDAGSGPEDLAERKRAMIYTLMAFSHALRMKLRREESALDDLAEFLPGADVELLKLERNPPNALLQRIGEQIEAAYRAGLCHPQHVTVLHQSLTILSDVQGGCERISNTPIPFAYTVLLRRIIGVYCYSLPFGVMYTLGALTPVVVLMMSYAFYGLDAIGDEIAEPFGNDANDLPLSAICTTIEIDLRQRLGEAELPEPAVPHHGLLL